MLKEIFGFCYFMYKKKNSALLCFLQNEILVKKMCNKCSVRGAAHFLTCLCIFILSLAKS